MTAKDLLRDRTRHDAHKVTSVELFFDLVFVFAVTQLSHALLEHFTVVGALRTGLLLLAVWWAWVYTSWTTNWLDPERLPVRVMLLAIMLAGLLLSASIPQSFQSRGLQFGAAYATIQVGRTVFVTWAMRHHAQRRRNFQRILVWLALSGAFWIGGGLVDGHTRFAVWLLALLIEYGGPVAYFWVPGWGRSTTAEWDVEGRHMAERCGLFIIIALGESILVTGATFAHLPWAAVSVAAFLAAFVGSLAMWWIYFDSSAEAASHAIASSGDPGRLARSAYTYSHVILVAGIILSAVADERVLAHPLGHTSAGTTAVIVLGPALFLVGNAVFCWTISRHMMWSVLIGAAAVLALAGLGSVLSPLVLAALATLVLAAVAVWESS